MTDKPSNLAVRIFEGVPRFAGEVFRATKVPSIVILSLFFAGVIAPAIIVTVLHEFYHWPPGLAIMAIGDFETSPPNIHIKLAPRTIALMRTMTPEQLTFAKRLSQLKSISAFAIVLAGIWWIARFASFVQRRIRKKL